MFSELSLIEQGDSALQLLDLKELKKEFKDYPRPDVLEEKFRNLQKVYSDAIAIFYERDRIEEEDGTWEEKRFAIMRMPMVQFDASLMLRSMRGRFIISSTSDDILFLMDEALELAAMSHAP